MSIITRFLLLATLAVSINMNAAHTAGAKLNYLQLDNDTYLISLSVIRDCASGGLGSTAFVDWTSICGSGSRGFPIANSIFVTQSCDIVANPSNCTGGTAPGYEVVTYQDTVTLGQGCGWRISWDLCCRNNSTNLSNPTSDNLYVEALIDPSFIGINNSPDFLDATIPIVCVNTPVERNPVAVDIDGDSLVFELVTALDFAATPVSYNLGYTGTAPIPGITIDPTNGTVNFTPTTIGNFVVVTMVSEYRNGFWIGSTMYDRQFVVTNCSNTDPFIVGNGMTNFSGNALQTGPNSISMCEGQNFCFDLQFDDIDAGQTLSIESAVQTILPGATITSSGTGPITATVCWTATAGTNGYYPIVVSAVDGVCPLQGSTASAVSVFVTPGTYAGTDVTSCNLQSATLGIYGFAPYQWSVISGDPIVIGSNFSCDTCLTAVATPSVTTTYLLTSNAPAGCAATDTVVINVVPNLSVDAMPDTAYGCINQPVQLNTVATPIDPTFTFSWSPTFNLSNSSIANPIFTGNSVGTTTLVVNVGNNTGCNEQDTVIVQLVATPPALDLGFDSIGVNMPPVTLTTGQPSGGTYLGAGVLGNVFNPAIAGPGTYQIWYSVCSGSSVDTIVVYQDVGIAELNGTGTVALVPNPAINSFRLSDPSISVDRIEIVDMLGRTVKQWSRSLPEYPVNDLTKGSYVVLVTTEDGILVGRLQRQ
jgi:hypothetical protein